MLRPQLIRTVFVLLLSIAAGAYARAAQNCGNQTLKGFYGEIGWGDVVVSLNPALVGPFARVGQTFSDGNGTIYSHTVASFNGQIFQVPEYTGQYNVNPDCKIVFHMMIPVPTPAGPLPLPIDLAGVISDNGRNMDAMLTSIAGGPPGVAVRILFRKQEKARCSNQDLSGSYALDMWGTNVTQAPAGSLARNGVLRFDGKGAFAADTVVSYGGGVVAESFSGTYSVDAACTLTLDYTLGSTAFRWIGGLADESKTASVMVVQPEGAVVLGYLKRQ